MRWEVESIKKGTLRYKHYFALLPQEIEGEWRWLEKVIVKQEASDDTGKSWKNLEFIDYEDTSIPVVLTTRIPSHFSHIVDYQAGNRFYKIYAEGADCLLAQQFIKDLERGQK